MRKGERRARFFDILSIFVILSLGYKGKNRIKTKTRRMEEIKVFVIVNRISHPG